MKGVNVVCCSTSRVDFRAPNVVTRITRRGLLSQQWVDMGTNTLPLFSGFGLGEFGLAGSHRVKIVSLKRRLSLPPPTALHAFILLRQPWTGADA